MSQELITNPNAAEAELKQMLEKYREHPVSSFETYGYFGLSDNEAGSQAAESRAQQKAAFLDGSVKNPRLAYPHLEATETPDVLQGFEKTLLDTMAESTDLAYDQDREAALYDILRIRYLETAILSIASRLNAGDLPQEETEQLVANFNAANDEIHGAIDPSYFNGLLDKTRTQAQAALSAQVSNPIVAEAAQYFLDNTGEPKGEIKMPIKVDKDKIESLQTLIKQRYSDVIRLVPDKGEELFSPQELADIFRLAHALEGNNWPVRLQAGQSIMDTRQSEKATVIGANKKSLNRDGVIKLLLHEDGVHLARRENGDNSGDILLGGLGLDRYLDSEEGIASIFEQIYTGKQKESGEQYYLCLGLAKGLDGQPRDFRDIFEIEWRRRLVVSAHSSDKEIDDASINKAKNQAYDACVRIYRGTPCNIPGMVYTKDQSYFKGNQTMWETFSQIAEMDSGGQQESINYLLAAKFDPTNPLHDRLVRKNMEQNNG